jgi:hypothetical protein
MANQHPALLLDCGEYSLPTHWHTHQERLVHYRELTTGERPVIVCTKTVSEYLQQERHGLAMLIHNQKKKCKRHDKSFS